MPSLNSLAVPFLSAYRQRERGIRDEEMDELKQASVLSQLHAQMQAREQAAQRQAMVDADRNSLTPEQFAQKYASPDALLRSQTKQPPTPAAQPETVQLVNFLQTLPEGHPAREAVQRRLEALGPKPVPEPKAPTETGLARLIRERDALPEGDARRTIYDSAIEKESKTARQIAPTVVVNPQGRAPAGYRFTDGGDLEPIKGGPADKPLGQGRALPTSAAQRLMENNQNLRRAKQALELIKGQVPEGDKQATGWKGYLPDAMLQRMDPEGVSTRAAIADLGSLVIHDRSGAAVTAAEFPRLRPFIPAATDDPKTAEKKLQRFVTEYERVVQEAVEFYKESGYSVPDAALRPANTASPGAAYSDAEKERRYQEWKAKQK